MVSNKSRLKFHLRRRNGNIVVLSCLMMAILMGLLAFACDLGYVLVSRTELQRTADSAAMASAWELLDEDRLLGGDQMALITTSARNVASSYVNSNQVNGDTMMVDLNNANQPQGDIVLGRYQGNGVLSTLGQPNLYNAVQVRVERTSAQNGPVAMFFAGIFGRNSLDAAAEAIATYKDGINGFKDSADDGFNSLLPFAVDVDDWMEVLNGQGTDSWVYNSQTQTLSGGADGLKELKLFPSTQNGNSGITPGNFGTVDIGADNNSSATLSRQIRDGVSNADLEYHGGEVKIDPTTGILNLDGDTGIDADLQLALDDIIGQARTIPLYVDVTGTGDTSNYEIVAFAGIRVLDVNLHGKNKYVMIQPAVVVDDAALSDDGTTSYGVFQPVLLTY